MIVEKEGQARSGDLFVELTTMSPGAIEDAGVVDAVMSSRGDRWAASFEISLESICQFTCSNCQTESGIAIRARSHLEAIHSNWLRAELDRLSVSYIADPN